MLCKSKAKKIPKNPLAISKTSKEDKKKRKTKSIQIILGDQYNHFEIFIKKIIFSNLNILLKIFCKNYKKKLRKK